MLNCEEGLVYLILLISNLAEQGNSIMQNLQLKLFKKKSLIVVLILRLKNQKQMTLK